MGPALVKSAYALGQGVGTGILVLLACAALLKCLQVLRRPTSDRRCLAALTLVVVAWLVSLVGQFAQRLFELEARWLSVLAGCVAVLLLITAAVLAIVGLATFDPVRHRQGRAQAIWVLVLCGLFAVGVLTVAALGSRKEFPGEESAQGGRPRVHERPEFNFALTSQKPWVELSASAVNPAACLALRRTRPELVCVVIAEEAGSVLDQTSLAAVSIANLESVAELLESERSEERIGALAFTRVRSRARSPGVGEFAYEHWILVQNGFAYQIIGWAAVEQHALLADEMDALVRTFRLLDPERRAEGNGSLARFAEPTLGLELDPSELGWSTWSELGEFSPLAATGGLRPLEAFLVVALPLDHAPPPLDALTTGLLASLDLEYPGGGSFQRRPFSPWSGTEGLELETERRDEETTYRYLVRVVRGARCAFLVAGWHDKELGDGELVRRTLERVRLSEPAGTPPALAPAARAARGLVWNDVGARLLAEQSPAAASPWFARAVADAPDDPVVLGNRAFALELDGREEEALALALPGAERFPADADLALLRARLLLETGRTDEAGPAALELAGRSDIEDAAFEELVDLFGEHDAPAAGRAAAEAFLARRDSLGIRRSLAYLHSLEGDLERAREILEPLLALHPEASELLLDLALVRSELGDHAGVEELVTRALALDPADHEAMRILGWSQIEHGRLREAKATFERAAELEPDDEDLADGLRVASAMLGQGDNTDVKTPLAPVEPPPELVAALAALAPPPPSADEPATVLLQQTGYHFERGQPARRTLTCRVRIGTAAAAAQWSTIRVGFDPLVERAYLERAEVRDAAGELVARATLDDVYVMNLDQDGLADHDRLLQVPVPGLEAGRTLEWSVTFESRAPDDEFTFRRHLLAQADRSLAVVVFVRGETSALTHAVRNAERVRTLTGTGFSAWWLEDAPRFAFEPYSVRVERHYPILYLGARGADWGSSARDYLAEIADRLAPDPRAAGLARELTRDLSDERARIAALARYVQRTLRYEALEFGVRGTRPNEAARTLELGYGDCKDHALLLVQLLGALGIESHLALVDTGWSLAPELPSLDQFDHMVVHVPALGPERLLDPTDKHLELGVFAADGLWESQALVLDPDAPRFIGPERRRPADFRVESRRMVTVEGNELAVEETLVLYGYQASWIRAFTEGLPEEARLRHFQEQLAPDGTVRLTSVVIPHPEPHGPVELTLAYRVPHAVTSDGRRRSLRLPAPLERFFLATPFLAERKTPFEWLEPVEMSSSLRLRLPSPVEADARARRAGRADEFCRWSLAASSGSDERELDLEFRFEALPGAHAAGRYPAFHDAFDAALRALETPIAWSE